MKRRTGELALLARLWPLARPDLGLFLAALVLSPLAMALALVQPWLLKEAVDTYIVPGHLDGLQAFAALYLAAALASWAIGAAYSMSLAVAGQRTILRLRELVYRHLLSLAPAFFDTRPAGALLTRATSDVDSLGDALTAGVITIILDALTVVGVLVAMLLLDWRLTLVLLAIAPPLLWILALCRSRLRRYYLATRECLARVNAYLAERIAGVELVQLFGVEQPSRESFGALAGKFRDAAIRSNVWDALMYAVVDGASAVAIALMLWYGSSTFLGGTVTAGLLVAFIDYLDRLFRPLREFSGKVAIIQRAAAALEKIWGLLDDARRIEPGEAALPRAAGRIRVRGLRFAYRDEDVLRGVDLEVDPGQVVAVVGSTGSGKTTLARLLTRSYDGYRGSITLDGIELSRIRLADLRRAVVSVRQDVHVFPGTVRFNVDLGDRAISFSRCREAASLVHADAFIDRLPGGWSHPLRERGANISGGEGQLLTFARAMAHDPRVIVLDEATASVDPVTEALVQDAIARILERKTVIVIAHRLSTVARADRILVMEAGRIVERGRHQELLAAGGRYAELVREGLGACNESANSGAGPREAH